LLGPNGTTLPSDIVGVNNEGKVVMNPDGNFHVHLQSLSFSVDMGREQIFELGRRGLYHRYVPFPVQVNAEIGVLSQSGDLIEAHSDRGIDRSAYPIQLIMREGLVVDLGSQNRLSSVNVTGGDVGGGNEQITYSYQNFNDFTVYHPEDPRSFSRPSVP